MKNKLLQQHVIGIPLFERSSKGLINGPGPTSNYHIQSHRSEQSVKFKQSRVSVGSLMVGMSKLGERADSIAHGIREHGE